MPPFTGAASLRGMVEAAPNPMDLAIAARLTRVRESLDMSATAMAAELHVAKSTYSSWERGVARVSLNGALRLKQRFGVPLDWLYFGEAAALPASRLRDWSSKS